MFFYGSFGICFPWRSGGGYWRFIWHAILPEKRLRNRQARILLHSAWQCLIRRILLINSFAVAVAASLPQYSKPIVDLNEFMSRCFLVLLLFLFSSGLFAQQASPRQTIDFHAGCHAPFKASYRQLFHGKALVIVQAGSNAPALELTASAKGLQQATLTVNTR